MIGQHFLRLLYKRRPRKDSILYRDTIRLLRELDGDTVDVGGGPGYLFNFLENKPYYVVQDIDYKMLSYGDRDLDLVQAGAEEKVFREKSFENSIVHDALHHFFDVRKTLENLISITRSNIYIFEIELATLTGKFIKTVEKLLGFPGNFYKSNDLMELIHSIEPTVDIKNVGIGKFRYLLKVVLQSQP